MEPMELLVMYFRSIVVMYFRYYYSIIIVENSIVENSIVENSVVQISKMVLKPVFLHYF